ncbi:MAG: hypothetical protein OEN50_11645 [Deltaproteobacteria bacterium]|nr:hypothetical protein [Deltaproteobacteria bacterium]
MKHSVVVAVCLLFLFGGVVKFLGDCFGKDHHEPGEEHHAAFIDEKVSRDAHQADETQTVQCPERRFDVSLAVPSFKLSPKQQFDEKRVNWRIDPELSRNPVGSSEYRVARRDKVATLAIPTGLSHHLFLSVLQI